MSRHNVEVFRCTQCGDQVALAPAGFTIDEDELDRRAKDHLKNECSSRNGANHLEKTHDA